MPKATKVTVELNLNQARSLITYIGLFGVAEKGGKKSDLFRALEQHLTGADWQGAASCLQTLEDAVQARS